MPATNFNILTGLTVGNVTANANANSLATSGNITAGNLASTGLTSTVTLTVSGTSNLGAIGNVIITGGSANQVIVTNGNGTLSFSNISSFAGGVQTAAVNQIAYYTSTSAVGGSANLTWNGANILTVTGAVNATNVSASTLSVVGNANVGNIGATNANLSAATITGNLATGNTSASLFTGNISGTSGVFSGNVTFGNINAVSGILGVTGNITGGNLITTGWLNVSGNANVGNLGATTGVFTNISGTLTTAAQPNITSVGTLSSLIVSGNLTVDTNTLFVDSVNNRVGIGNTSPAHTLRVEGTFSASGNANVGNMGATAGVFTGNVSAGNLTVSGTSSITGNFSAGNLITGNLTLGSDALTSSHHTITIDPSTAGAGGNVIVQGNLQVTGTTTTVNSTTLEVTDLNITVAKDAVNAAAANGAGLTVAGASATMTYASTGDKWTFNKPLDVTGSLTASTTLSVTGNANVGNIGSNNAVFTGTLNVTGNSTQGNITTGNTITYGQFGTPIKLRVLSDNSLSFDGSSGQLFSITDTLTGDIFSVNDITGLPSIRVDSNATVYLAEISGNVGIGNVAPAHKLSVTGTMNVSGNANVGNLGAAAGVFSGNISAGNINSVSGILSVTGNANVGNIGATRGVFTNVVGTLETAAQTNITSVGTLSSLTVSGNATFDTNTLFVDSVNNRVGVGTNAPGAALQVSFSSASNGGIFVTNSSTGPTEVQFWNSTWTSTNYFAVGQDSTGAFLFTQGAQPIRFFTNGVNEAARITSTQNILIGTTTDGNYRFEVGKSGSAGTVRFYDQTATTGVTRVHIRAGAGQSTTDLFQVLNNSTADILFAINSSGGFFSGLGGSHFGLYGNFSTSTASNSTNVLRFGSNTMAGWSSGTDAGSSTPDVALSRNAAGVLEINNGTAGTYRDLILRNITSSGQITSTRANDTANGGGQIYLNGATGNRIDFNINGVAAPSFSPRSAGTKIVLYPNVGASAVDFAIGIESSTLWNSVGDSGHQFKWYAGTTNIATLTGAGNFTLVGNLTVDTNTLFVDSVNNRVGIGTTSPATTLEISGTNAIARITGTSSSIPQLQLSSAGSVNWSLRSNQSGSSEFTIFQDSTERVRINSSGNVGIATTNPAYALHVQPVTANTSGVNNIFRVGTESTTPGCTSRISMFVSSDPVNDTNGGKIFIDAIRTANMDLAISLNDVAGAAPVERFRISGSGNVGIGNASPTHTLRVEGTVSATGNANVGNIGATRGVFTNVVGTLETAAQTNITSVGTLTSLAVTGNITSGNVSGTRGAFTNISGTLETAAQTNITSVGTLTSLTVSGNLTVDTNTLFVDSVNNRVGIQFTTPTFPLSFGSTTGNKIGLYENGTGIGYGLGIQASLLQIYANSSGDRVGIGYGNSSSFTETLSVKAGNVGVGNTSPTHTLRVEGTVSATGNANVGNLGAAAGVFTGAITGSTTLNITGNANVGNIGATNANVTSITATGACNFATSSGNVGIGTSSPAYKLEVNGSFAATTKSFVIDHPTKSRMKLRYGSLEGPENGVYVRGRSSSHVIDLPEYWSKLVDPDSVTVNITPIGQLQSIVVVAYDNQQVTLAGVEAEYFYTVYAERIDVDPLLVEFQG